MTAMGGTDLDKFSDEGIIRHLPETQNYKLDRKKSCSLERYRLRNNYNRAESDIASPVSFHEFGDQVKYQMHTRSPVLRDDMAFDQDI